MGGNCSIPDIIPYNRVETERVIPKLEFNKSAAQVFYKTEQERMEVCYLARISIW